MIIERRHIYLAQLKDGQLIYVSYVIVKRRNNNSPMRTYRVLFGVERAPMRSVIVLKYGKSVESNLMYVMTEKGELSWHLPPDDERPQWNGAPVTKLLFEDYDIRTTLRRTTIRKKPSL